MTDAHQLPPNVTESEERIKGRPYESDFARFPPSEIHPRTTPGAGPQGPVAAGPVNVPLVVMAVGALLMFGVFFVNTWILFVLGLLLVLVGAAMTIVTHNRPGRRSGLGQSRVRRG